ncbi:phage antirepressor KilAC domain-containing protein [Salininema proteolyticum]|uniref:Phage antirepressor KilAC domain-containing protein n=1 Tax=Salininema proteolyticum TaxID=1607685 RepID=A0ABV8U007_9ACTN
MNQNLRLIRDEDNRSLFDEIKHVNSRGTESWSGRELLLGAMRYRDWTKAKHAINRAREVMKLQGISPDQHVISQVGVSKIVNAVGGRRQVEDFRLTRTGAYFVAMCGDPSKPEIAAALTYFNIMTQAAERIARKLPETFGEALRELADEVERREVAETKVALLEPKAEIFDKWLSSDGLASFRDAVRMLREYYGEHITEPSVRVLLQSWGLTELYSNAATARATRNGWMRNRAGLKASGAQWVQGKFTRRGLEYLLKKWDGAGDARRGTAIPGVAERILP